MHSDPILYVLAYSALAAGMAGLGALPYASGRKPRLGGIGAAYAVAGGLMLGAGYLLLVTGLREVTLTPILGAALGVLYTFWIQSFAGIDDLDTRPGQAEGRAYGYKVILQNTLHAASEGVAIGVAMVVHLPLGVFVALALAIHNAGEGMALTEVLKQRGVSTSGCAALAVVTNISQILLAVSTYAVLSTLGSVPVALTLGFAAGSLLFLVLTELAPASYERAPTTLIALLMTSAAGAVVFLEDVLL